MGLPELLLIFVIALLLFGPRKLPEIGKTLGKAMNEFKRATNDLQRSLEEEVAADELKQTRREVQDAAKSLTFTVPAEPAAAAPQTPPAAPAAPVPSEPPEPGKPEPKEPK